jgi:histidinol-phosphate/aromatic aminotransferase/cobyric acid decarboxylase-like protein
MCDSKRHGQYELSDWVRVTAGLRKENKLFIEKLKNLKP